MENNLYYSINTGAGNQRYVNIARDLARLNGKNEEITTRDGHVFGYMVNVTAAIGADQTLIAYTAPNSWRLRNSFRKWHAYRDMYFEHAGINTREELGRYGHTMRPYLDASHKGGTTLDMVTLDSKDTTVNYNKGAWTYTTLSSAPTYTATDTPISGETQPIVDEWDLHICEATDVTDGSEFKSGTYKSVGMIHSYNLDRVIADPSALVPVDGPSNPLAALISSGDMGVGEVLEIAESLELELPPYDTIADGNTINEPVNAFKVSASTAGTISFNAFVPAGMMRIWLKTDVSYPLHIQVLGKVLCKDMS